MARYVRRALHANEEAETRDAMAKELLRDVLTQLSDSVALLDADEWLFDYPRHSVQKTHMTALARSRSSALSSSSSLAAAFR